MHKSYLLTSSVVMIFWCSVLTALVLQAACKSWPQGKYALLKPTTGCPEGWNYQGWLLQDTEDTSPSNNRSEILHIDGYVSPSYVIRSFCVKTYTAQGPDYWPQGRYCIYRKRDEILLTGFEKAEVKMNNEKSSNKDTAKYVSYHNWIYYSISKNYSHLVLYFQCKTDGNTKVPISLPITKPFYLLPYGSRECQQVKWMVATSEWIKYHTNNHVNRTGQMYHDGTAPYYELGGDNNKGLTMYYCYYESCNYTLRDKNGVFQSPGFPGEYPDGQLCSWRIMVPDNHTLHVRFTNFSLDENDNLTFSINYNDRFYLHDTFFGLRKQSFTITSTSNVLFVFLTNEEGNSTGFRAEYNVFQTPETTPSLPPTTANTEQHSTLNTNTGILDTTTIPTTETKNKTNNSTTDIFKKSFVRECDGGNTTILIVIPLICLIVVVAIVIVLYRWRSKKMKCEKCASQRYRIGVTNQTYIDGRHIPIHERTTTETMETTLDTDHNDGQIHKALSQGSGNSEYHELSTMDNKVPDVVYDMGPDSDQPLDDAMYQVVDKETTQNPLYQSATNGMKNPIYDSAA